MGWVFLLPAQKGVLRIVVGLLTSQASLLLAVAVLPYRRLEDNVLAVAGQFVLVMLFIGSILIKAFEDVSTEAALLGDKHFGSRVLGFATTGGIVAALLIFTFGMLVLLLVASVAAVRRDALVPTLRLTATGAPPELTMRSTQVWHIFLSHIWSTGQVRHRMLSQANCRFTD